MYESQGKMLELYRGFNILRYGEKLWRIAQDEGAPNIMDWSLICPFLYGVRVKVFQYKCRLFL
jgi:hypothetical protein